MDAIKKKMQAMKLEKDNAMDRADACEQQAKDANLRAERVGRRIYYFLCVNSFGALLGAASTAKPSGIFRMLKLLSIGLC